MQKVNQKQKVKRFVIVEREIEPEDRRGSGIWSGEDSAADY